MRNGQKRMRGRSGGGGGGGGGGNNNNNNNHRKSQNPLTRVYESNGPDVKIRGTASHIAEKYMQLARDSQSSGDPVAAENYFQHAEHYFRLIATAQEQFRQQNPYYNNPAPTPGAPTGAADDNYDDGDDDGQPFVAQPGEQNFNQQQPQPPQPQQQPYLPRDAQPFPPRDQPQHNRPQHQPQQNHQPRPVHNNNAQPEVTGLPAFITGGGQPQPVVGGDQGDANGEGQGDRPDRFGRRRRRHRSGSNFRPDRPDFNGNVEAGAAPAPSAPQGGDEPPRQPD
jgi:hypothetical protein